MNRHWFVCGMMLVAAVLSLLGCGGQSGVVRGTVTRAEDGSAVAEARVTVFELSKFEDVTGLNAYKKGAALQTVTTGPEGAYSVTLEPDSYMLEFQAEGLQTTTQLVEVKSGRGIDIYISLRAAP